MMTVYTKPDCGQCMMTVRVLESKGIDFRAIDLTDDAEALATVKAMGYAQAPVVVTGDDHWAGFRPDKLMKLVR